MKKTAIYTESERFWLFYGIESVYGGYILETGGDPTCLNELEDAQNDQADSLIESISDIINDPRTPWEACDEEDEEYVKETLESLGIA